MKNSVWIGYDTRETEAFAVARHSIRRHSPGMDINALDLGDLRERGLYHRPTSRREGRLWDDISDAPMSTEFAISRFLTPLLAKSRWALFMDCDVLLRADINEIFDRADSRYAVMCVKHRHNPPEGTKMDGQLQVQYARKNWSSVVLYNTQHPSNGRLSVEMINERPGRDLHRFCWLDDDDEIGELPPEFNWLVGHSSKRIDPILVHFTTGTPNMAGYENVPFAGEWFDERQAWLNGRLLPNFRYRRNGLDAHV